MLPFIDTNGYCFGIPYEALDYTLWDKTKKEHIYPSKKLNNNNISGVYAIFSFKHGFLYVGKAKHIRGRLRDHFGFTNNPIGCLYKTIEEDVNYNISMKDLEKCMIIIFPISDTTERGIFELTLIKALKPIFNYADNPFYD